jgi:hypothetical protein
VSKYTKSGDGRLRRTFRVEVRLTHDEVEDILKAMDRREGMKGLRAIQTFLKVALQAGIQDGLFNYYEQKDADDEEAS